MIGWKEIRARNKERRAQNISERVLLGALERETGILEKI